MRLIPVRRANMRPHAWFMDDIELRAYRHTIETINSQLEKMGIERLYARTNAGFELKVHATPDMTTLSREVTAWEERRNKACRKVVWRHHRRRSDQAQASVSGCKRAKSNLTRH